MTVEAAQAAALRVGMFLTPDPAGGPLVQVHCPRCGWGRSIGFDVIPEKYAAEPYGCPACREQRRRP